MDIVDAKTGEVLNVILKEVVPFRSITDLKGYSDGENFEPGTSEVDLTGYEPLSSIIARCTRTMVAPGGQVYSVIDVDAVKAESVHVPESVDYEAGSAKTLDEAFATEDPTECTDFDFADGSRILSEIGSKQVANENLNVESVANNVKIKEALDSSANEAEDDFISEENASGTKSPSAA